MKRLINAFKKAIWPYLYIRYSVGKHNDFFFMFKVYRLYILILKNIIQQPWRFTLPEKPWHENGVRIIWGSKEPGVEGKKLCQYIWYSERSSENLTSLGFPKD